MWNDQLINQLATDSTDNGKKIKTKALTENKLDKISANSAFIKKKLTSTLHIRNNSQNFLQQLSQKPLNNVRLCSVCYPDLIH
jgi:hypothetical protein